MLVLFSVSVLAVLEPTRTPGSASVRLPRVGGHAAPPPESSAASRRRWSAVSGGAEARAAVTACSNRIARRSRRASAVAGSSGPRCRESAATTARPRATSGGGAELVGFVSGIAEPRGFRECLPRTGRFWPKQWGRGDDIRLLRRIVAAGFGTVDLRPTVRRRRDPQVSDPVAHRLVDRGGVQLPRRDHKGTFACCETASQHPPRRWTVARRAAWHPDGGGRWRPVERCEQAATLAAHGDGGAPTGWRCHGPAFQRNLTVVGSK
jgi:hypothetical protein